ncbi:MAG: hypothetical protein AVDCRST_MAG45-292 [uncultured Solirubrobacterales bacterium]|uniref:GH74 n=1 Tax=uncultured Solirubrobacterales bacterium TaxID=768556 RepID=A0A6J4RW75_9ACTN|nr:MAG: hypothetical protein AVDCRST_MAG45-292 [uncultured Solirubrobacterales bacterium]
MRSSDGGANWVDASAGLPEDAGVKLIDDPRTPGRVFADARWDYGEASALYETTDGGASWHVLKRGVRNAAFHSGSNTLAAVAGDYNIGPMTMRFGRAPTEGLPGGR